jgi:hypothetical protein
MKGYKTVEARHPQQSAENCQNHDDKKSDSQESVLGAPNGEIHHLNRPNGKNKKKDMKTRERTACSKMV